jgi:hypothetical protein
MNTDLIISQSEPAEIGSPRPNFEMIVEQSITLNLTDEPNLEGRLRQCFLLLGYELPCPLGFDVGQVVLKVAKPDVWSSQGNQMVKKLSIPATQELPA